MRIELTPSAWKAEVLPLNYIRILERKTRFELATLALARRCSTPEPLPHNFLILYAVQAELATTCLVYHNYMLSSSVFQDKSVPHFNVY